MRKAIAIGVLAAAAMLAVYLGILVLAESWRHALDLLSEDALFVGPLVAGFGVQVGLYTYMRRALKTAGAQAGTITGISGTSSTASMIACCVHHVTDFLPLLGVSAAATFLARYKSWLMGGALVFNLIGIAVMVYQLARHRRVIHHVRQTTLQHSLEGLGQ